MRLEGKTVAILVEQLYEDIELWYPYYRLREEGAEVMIVGPKAGESYPSKHGFPARAALSADKAVAEDFDGVVIPGGYSPDHMRRHPAMVKFVADAVNAGKIVGVICHGGWMLCSADVLHGRQVTSYPSIRDDIVHAGAEWVDREVVRDDNLVTSRQPDDLPAFMPALVEALAAVPAAT